MDHYCVWAPKCNYNWPPFYWDEIKFAGYYAAEIKRAAEPRPVWNWAQGLSTTWDLRCTTADEIRSQWYQVLGRGTKGILWFQYTESWAEKCPSSSTDEVVRLARELASLKEILLEGEVAAPGTVASTSQKKIDVSATVSPHGIALFLTNLNYCLHLILPYTWNPALAVSVDVTPPQGLEPMDFLLLQGDQKVPLHWERISERLWRFYLPSLKVAEAVVVVPEP
jgi:hypothetical protein